MATNVVGGVDSGGNERNMYRTRGKLIDQTYVLQYFQRTCTVDYARVPGTQRRSKITVGFSLIAGVRHPRKEIANEFVHTVSQIPKRRSWIEIAVWRILHLGDWITGTTPGSGSHDVGGK